MDVGKLGRIARLLGGAVRSPASPGDFVTVVASDQSVCVSFETDPSNGWEALQFELPHGFELRNQIVSRFSRVAGFRASGDAEDLRRRLEDLGYEWTPEEALRDIGRDIGVEPRGDVRVVDLGAGAQLMVSGVVTMVTQVRASSS